MNRGRGRHTAACSIAMLLLSALPAMAQHSASIYLDATADQTSVYAIVDAADGPQDCSHSGYSTGAWLQGPTGYASGSQSGFSHGVSLPLADGDFTEAGNLSFTCGCWGSYTSPDATQGMKITSTTYGLTEEYPDVCRYGELACSSGAPTCNEAPLTIYPAVNPCARYRKARYLKITDQSCWSIFSTGRNSPDACT